MIIIGASSGIGRELAIQYAALGWKVGISGRRIDLLQDICRLNPAQLQYECFDATGPDNIHGLTRLLNQLGGADLVIYCAGYGGTSEQFEQVIEQRTFEVNARGFLDLVIHSFHYFQQKGSGQIAVISSVAGIRGNSFAPAYSATKAFVSVYAEGLNLKAHRLGLDIVVSDIRPGFVNTEQSASKSHQKFWSAPVSKAAAQIIRAVHQKKRRAYITKRWWLAAVLLRIAPWPLIRKFL